MLPSKFDTFEEQVFFSTVRIERPDTQSMGTGFLVSINAPIKNQRYVFLISNKHVLDDPGKETRLVFHTTLDNKIPNLGDTFKFNILQFQNGYYIHDNPEADLALLNISEFYELAKNYNKKMLFHK